MCPSVFALLSNVKRKSLLIPWKLGSIKSSKYQFGASVVVFDLYLFQLIVPVI